MRRAVIDDDGVLDLGDDARRAGYTPGQLVDVLVTRAGTLIISLADADHEVIDLAASRLPAGKARKMITGRSR